MSDTAPGRDWSSREVGIPAGSQVLKGTLTTGGDPGGVVVFAHGSGSSRQSPRNLFVATALNGAGLGTLLFDLLTEREEADRSRVFDIQLLAERLVAAVEWLRPTLQDPVSVGLFGASTGAAAALVAAAELTGGIGAVVSRGGRPDLAGDHLGRVTAPTLLLVGGLDLEVLDLNRWALDRMSCERQLEIVPGASHLFEEPGTLELVTTRATLWFRSHL